MINNILNLRNLTGLLLVLIACGLSFRELKEPDLWWQLRTGEWMLEHGQITMQDIFSFTHEGVEWINVKWGFEVVYAWLSNLAGPEIILLLQALVLIGILALLAGTIKTRAQASGTSLRDGSITAVLLLFMVICGFRFNARPEMFSHLMLAAYLYVLTKAKTHPKLLWALIPLQIAWSNMHEAYGMGAVLMGIYVFSILLESKLLKQKTRMVTLLPIALAILSIGINPRGITLYTHPLEIFSQLGENQFTTELYGWTDKNYYDFAGVTSILVAIIALVRIIKTPKGKPGRLKSIMSVHGAFLILTLIAFLVLGLKSHRNIPFMMIAVLPMMSGNLLGSIKNHKASSAIAICLCAIMMLVIPTNGYYNLTRMNQKFGYKVSATQTPLGAAQFLKHQQIKGKGFTDYFSSSYLLWKLQPEFKTYLDLRDLDIFPAAFMTNVQQAYLAPDARLAHGQTLWQFLDSLDRFEYVVLLNSENFMNLNRYLVHQTPDFELVYADPLSSVFVRTNGANKGLIEKYGFANGGRNVFHGYSERPIPDYGQQLITAVHPGYKYQSTSNQELVQLMNAYYHQMGFHQLVNKFQPLPPA